MGAVTGAAALDEGAGQHVGRGEQGAHQPTAEVEFGVASHTFI